MYADAVSRAYYGALDFAPALLATIDDGFDPAPFACHPLRSGLATAAANAAQSERSIIKQNRHPSVSIVGRYIRDAELFDDNAAAGIGL
jgi:hypothetical protein